MLLFFETNRGSFREGRTVLERQPGLIRPQVGEPKHLRILGFRGHQRQILPYGWFSLAARG